LGIPLDFEKPLAELRKRLETLEKQIAGHPKPELERERESLQAEVKRTAGEVYASLDPWQKVQVARFAQRPHTLDYVKAIFTEYVEFHGDRFYGDDKAIVGGPARLDGRVVMLVGHQRGRGTKDQVERNVGQPHPEGYRKALRLYRQAERFSMPVVTFVDTPGASSGLEDEERGQAWALAENIATLSELRTPIVVVVIGQGGSGGALALGVGDRVLLLEHAFFSVAAPEAAANILYRDPKRAPLTAVAQKITAQELRDLGLIDRVVPEPIGGAHADPAAAAETLGSALKEEVRVLQGQPLDRLIADRYEKYRRFGIVLNG
jgi:acetyl-CoA carboxylase carboxyl transferase subunit alpha